MMKRIQWIAAALAVGLLAACGGPEQDAGNGPAGAAAPAGTPAPVAETPAGNPAATEATEIVPGLTMRVLRQGNGATAEPGQTAVVHYTGWLYDPATDDHRGKKFDSSVDRGQPFEFPLGAGAVIQGWDRGIEGMHVGEIRELTIGPELAYGDRGASAVIPPGATLVFEVELLDLRPAEAS